MVTPEISVLLPFLHASQELIDAVESVLMQEGPEFEVILVDNSTAGNFLLNEKFNGDKRIVRVHEPRPGIALALNKGLLHCRGKYIARMDADDLCLPGRLSVQSRYLNENPSIGLVAGQIVYHSLGIGQQGMKHYVDTINQIRTHEQIMNHRFIDAPFAHPSVMFRKELIDIFGGYSTDALPEDYELWLRWLKHGIKMHKIDQPVLIWNDPPDRLSRNHTNYSRESFDRVRVKYLAEQLSVMNPSALPVFIWGGGKYSRKKASMLQQVGIKISGFIDVVERSAWNTLPYLHFTKIPEPGSMIIVSTVSNRDQYLPIRQHLNQLRYSEGVNFLISS